MANKEKAVGIGLHVRDLYISKGIARYGAENASLLAQQSAMEMAKWKDEQVKEYLEKKRDVERELSVANVDNPKSWNRHDAKWEILNEIINELFKE